MLNPVREGQGRSQDFFKGTHNFPNLVETIATPPPSQSPPNPLSKPLPHRATVRQTFMTHEASFVLAKGANFQGARGHASPENCET